MAFIRNLLDSFILILIEYSIFELLDRIISTIIMKFPSSYNLFDFCWLAFSSAYYLIIKTEFNYYFLLAFISVIIIDLVEILISKNLGEALSREFLTVLFLYLLSGKFHEILFLLIQPNPNISISFFLDLKTGLSAFIILYAILALTAVFYFNVSQRILKSEEEEEET